MLGGMRLDVVQSVTVVLLGRANVTVSTRHCTSESKQWPTFLSAGDISRAYRIAFEVSMTSHGLMRMEPAPDIEMLRLAQ